MPVNNLPKMAHIFLGIGSNLGDRGENIKKALVGLEQWGLKILRTSSLYETEPVGFKDQPMFYNMAALAETSLKPEELPKIFQAIEQVLGREKTFKNGPRTIDIDFLFYDSMVLKMEGLILPHPRLHERNFVLLPLNEIAPDFIHPVFQKTIQELLEASKDPNVARIL